MNWLHYLIEANLYLTAFYILYCLLLNNETHYTLNRVYLMATSVISFILPLVQIGLLKPAALEISALEFAIPTTTVQIVNAPTAPVEQHFTLQDAVLWVYSLGAAVLLLAFLIKIFQLYLLAKRNSKEADNGYKLVYLDGSNTAFSFFNFLFIGTKIKDTGTVIKHELVHIRQKHSADIIFIELLKIISWFNPVIYLLQRSLKAQHEYIADEKTAGSASGAITYSSFLVNNAYGLGGPSITHSFFNYNLLKKRIIMLHQKRSGSLARLKYLLALPVCAGLLCASTLAFSKDYGWIDIAPAHSPTADKPGAPVIKHKPMPRLLVKQNGVTVLTDKFSEQRADGTTRYYTAYNLSNKDKVDLAKRGIIVNVLYDVKIDSLPPPAPPVNKKLHKLPPPVIIPNPPPAATASQHELKPPPPPPADYVYKDFFEYVQGNLPYPKEAIQHNIQGNVVAEYTLDENHHITAVKIMSSSDKLFDNYVINAVKTYNGNIDKPAGNYALGVNFDIEGETDHKAAVATDAKMEQIGNLAGIVTIIGAVHTKKSPPVKPGLNRGVDSTGKGSTKTPAVHAAAAFYDWGNYIRYLYNIGNC